MNVLRLPAVKESKLFLSWKPGNLKSSGVWQKWLEAKPHLRYCALHQEEKEQSSKSKDVLTFSWEVNQEEIREASWSKC